MMLSAKAVPLKFMEEALEHLKPGAQLVMNVPAKIGVGLRSQNPVLKPGSDEVWVLECVNTMTFTKPEFQVPDESELTTTPSGLKYKTIREGTGKTPTASNGVLAHYAGWLTDGTGFDNSYDRGAPLDFNLGGVIAGWTEGLQLMKEGGATLFVIPPSIGYGARGAGGAIPPNATLVFYVELVSVK